jgi:hypothetical protein
MNIVISPRLDGLASERLRAFAAQLASASADAAAIRDLTRTEAAWARRTPLLNGHMCVGALAPFLTTPWPAPDCLARRSASSSNVSAEIIAPRPCSASLGHPG